MVLRWAERSLKEASGRSNIYCNWGGRSPGGPSVRVPASAEQIDQRHKFSKWQIVEQACRGSVDLLFFMC